MLKPILVFAFFCLVAAALKPAPDVRELTKVNELYCKDICK